MFEGFSVEVQPDCDAFMDVLTGRAEPKRVFFAELFLDREIQDAVAERFGLSEGLDENDPWYWYRKHIRVHRFLGYDYAIATPVKGLEFPRPTDLFAEDTEGGEQSKGRREWVNENKGPVTSWEEFERYPWPEPGALDTSLLEWMERNLPDDMCYTVSCHSVFEQMMWLMGLESLSFAMVDAPDLVEAVAERVGEIYLAAAGVFAQFERCRFFFGGDDMGFKTATMISPDDLRRLVLPWHRKITEKAHSAGKANVLHSCGNLRAIMPDLVREVRLDGKHSFEDVIQPVEDVFAEWGGEVSILGGIDVDFLCRSSEEAIRRRVRDVLDKCFPGRYFLGTGNTVANYIPLDNYLYMLDEGRRYTA